MAEFDPNEHDHDGISAKRINPKHLLPLPIFSAVPTASQAPNIFIYINGGTKRLYVKHESTLSYTALT